MVSNLSVLVAGAGGVNAERSFVAVTRRASSRPTIEQCHLEVPLTGASRWSNPGHPKLTLIAGGNSRKVQ